MSDIPSASFSDAFTYIYDGEGLIVLNEPFYEMNLIDPYPFDSFDELEQELKSQGRILPIEISAHKSTYIIDRVLTVSTLSSALLEANQAVWSKRKWVAIGATALGGALALAPMTIGLVAINGGGLASLMTAFGVSLIGLALFTICLRRTSSANRELAKNSSKGVEEIAQKRSELLEKGFWAAKDAKGTFGSKLTENQVIAPKECEWLWTQSIKLFSQDILNPPKCTTRLTEGELEFAKLNPFKYIDQALVRPLEDGKKALFDFLSPGKSHYSALSDQIQKVANKYHQTEKSILENAQRNISQLYKDLHESCAFIDSIYKQQVSSAQFAYRAALAPLQPELRGLSAIQKAQKIAAFKNSQAYRATLRAYKERLRDCYIEHKSAKTKAEAWFNGLIREEEAKKERDLSANESVHQCQLKQLRPVIREILRWTMHQINLYEEQKIHNVQPAIPSRDLPTVPLPDLWSYPRELETAQAPKKLCESDITSWWPVAMGSVAIVAAAGGLYALWQRFQSERTDALRTPPEETHRPEPSAPPIELMYDDAPPPYEEAPPSYEETMRRGA